MTIGIIGCGNMGGALLTAFCKQTKHTIIATDRSRGKVEAYGGGIYRELPTLLSEADVIVLAMKPQAFSVVAQEISEAVKNKLIVSILAGVSIARIRELLGAARIIRCMPNMPATVGSGVLGWYADGAKENEKEILDSLFQLAGESIELPSEKLVDQITLISGCGPAYFSLFAEMLENEAMRLGFDSATAVRIVAGTLQGSARVLASDITPTDLRIKVTSKGGVTEAVLKSLEAQHFTETFSKGIDVGIARMSELNKK
jgi:pyrroline-5-carboxylate reductase